MTVKQLIEIAESIKIPPHSSDSGLEDFMDFVTPGGWTISVFYDCGDFNYTEYFTSPSGVVYDVWLNREIKGERHIHGDIKRLQNWWPKEAVEEFEWRQRETL